MASDEQQIRLCAFVPGQGGRYLNSQFFIHHQLILHTADARDGQSDLSCPAAVQCFRHVTVQPGDPLSNLDPDMAGSDRGDRVLPQPPRFLT
jgi:hypothetical protein